MLGVTVNGDAPKATVHPPAALRLFKLQARRRERGGSSSLAIAPSTRAGTRPRACLMHLCPCLAALRLAYVRVAGHMVVRMRAAALAARSITRVGYPRA